jgi:hypothetical protein
MAYCYDNFIKGHLSILKPIQKMIPSRYLKLDCLFKNIIYFSSFNRDKLYIYSDKGLLKQLDLLKRIHKKFISIKHDTDPVYDFVTTKKNIKNLIIYIRIRKYKHKHPFIIERLLKNVQSIYIRNALYYQNIKHLPLNILKKMKSKTKYSKTMTYNEEIEWKLKVAKENNLDKEFYKQYKLDEIEARNIIDKVEKSKDFASYYKKTKSKFKPYSLEKEIKEIKTSIFFTCKVATKYKKLFPNY